MNQFTYTIKEPLAKGLAPAGNPRNRPMLSDSVGAFPFDGTLQGVPSFSLIDVSSLGEQTFPYPQLFVTPNVTIVCTQTAIYEYNGSSLTLKLGSLTAGVTWSCIAYKDFIYLTNGKVAVTRDPQSLAYAIDTTVPFATCGVDYNGQALLGSVNQSVTSI